jgi:hypothetical protein
VDGWDGPGHDGGSAGRCRAAADLTPQPRPSNLPLIRLGAAGDFSSRRTS